MRDFLTYEAGAGSYSARTLQGGRHRFTPQYVEFETYAPAGTVLERDAYMVAYQLGITGWPGVWCVVNFDCVFRGLRLLDLPSSEPDLTRKLVLIRFLMERWPMFGALLGNGMERHFADAAIVRILDPDDASPKWCIGTFVGNLSPDSAAADGEAARLMAGLTRAQQSGAHLLNQFSTMDFDVAALEREISAANMRRRFQGIMQWLDQNKEVLVSALTAPL